MLPAFRGAGPHTFVPRWINKEHEGSPDLSLENRVEVRLAFQAGMGRVPEGGKYACNCGTTKTTVLLESPEAGGIKLERGHSLLEDATYLTQFPVVGT